MAQSLPIAGYMLQQSLVKCLLSLYCTLYKVSLKLDHPTSIWGSFFTFSHIQDMITTFKLFFTTLLQQKVNFILTGFCFHFRQVCLMIQMMKMDRTCKFVFIQVFWGEVKLNLFSILLQMKRPLFLNFFFWKCCYVYVQTMCIVYVCNLGH